MTAPNPRSLFARTLANDGGTFEMHADNFERRDITSGYVVGIVVGTFAYATVNEPKIFNYGIARAIEEHPEADAIGTWIDSDTGYIHIDPVVVVATFEEAKRIAIANKQIAFFHLDTMTEHRV